MSAQDVVMSAPGRRDEGSVGMRHPQGGAPLSCSNTAQQQIKVDPLPEGYHKEDTLFIFDWDDTILPTTWLALNELRVDMVAEVPQHLKVQLEEYAPWAMRTLEEAKKYGKVLIVTNAEDGWIELTIKKFFPSWEQMLDTIPYHSARSTWEPTGCTLPVEWKVRSFAHEIEQYYGTNGRPDCTRRNIIGLGDSTSDREAMLHVTGGKAGTTGKSLKFMERPNLEHLQKQHHLIASSIRQIALHEKSLDLCIQHQLSEAPRQAHDQAQGQAGAPTTSSKVAGATSGTGSGTSMAAATTTTSSGPSTTTTSCNAGGGGTSSPPAPENSYNGTTTAAAAATTTTSSSTPSTTGPGTSNPAAGLLAGQSAAGGSAYNGCTSAASAGPVGSAAAVPGSRNAFDRKHDATTGAACAGGGSIASSVEVN